MYVRQKLSLLISLMGVNWLGSVDAVHCDQSSRIQTLRSDIKMALSALLVSNDTYQGKGTARVFRYSTYMHVCVAGCMLAERCVRTRWKQNSSMCFFDYEWSQYHIRTTTGTDLIAGTNSEVFLILIGTRRKITKYLDTPEDDFLAGAENVFQFDDVYIGELMDMAISVTTEDIIIDSWNMISIIIKVDEYLADLRKSPTKTFVYNHNTWFHGVQSDYRYLNFTQVVTSN